MVINDIINYLCKNVNNFVFEGILRIIIYWYSLKRELKKKFFIILIIVLNKKGEIELMLMLKKL